MPYIEPKDRERLFISGIPLNPGELNYLMAGLIRNYISMQGVSYTTFNDIAGVLSCLSMEIYRRLTGPYEDKKIELNGDVF